MSNAGSADLQNIADEMTSLLERRIGDLLGNVKAAREVTGKLVQADEEIEKLERSRVRLAAVLDPLDGDEAPETHELRRRLDQTSARIQRLQAQRGKLTDTLLSLKSKLDG